MGVTRGALLLLLPVSPAFAQPMLISQTLAQVSASPGEAQLPVNGSSITSGQTPTASEIQQQGDRIVINGVSLTVPWVQWRLEGRDVFGVSDVALQALGGIDLLNTDNPFNQPVAWRESPLQEQPQRLELPAVLTSQARFLDLTPLQTTAQWNIALSQERDGSTSLKIQTRSILLISNLLLGRALGNVFGPHEIQWAPGIRWQQSYVRQGGAEFPVTQLRLQLGSKALNAVTLAPIWPADDDIAGIAPIGQTAANQQVVAAINGGFFNRKNQTPLGAIREGGRWVSGPILNRGAIAWDDKGNVAMGRLKLEEVLVATQPPEQTDSTRDASKADVLRTNFSLISLNSGYLKAGFSRYTRNWGTSYVPLTDNEVLIYVKNGEVIEQRETQLAGEGQFPIPQGNPLVTYLVVARSNRTGAAKLPIGTRLRLQQQVNPPALADFPHALGGGPLLVQDHQVVLDASIEGFSKAFQNQRAPRSAAVAFADGEFALLTVHERIGGKGPTLVELAELLKSLGAQAALNLDGGSSTQLLLGGKIINRNPRSAARVHNGLGVFPVWAEPEGLPEEPSR